MHFLHAFSSSIFSSSISWWHLSFAFSFLLSRSGIVFTFVVFLFFLVKHMNSSCLCDSSFFFSKLGIACLFSFCISFLLFILFMQFSNLQSSGSDFHLFHSSSISGQPSFDFFTAFSSFISYTNSYLDAAANSQQISYLMMQRLTFPFPFVHHQTHDWLLSVLECHCVAAFEVMWFL